MQAPRAAAGELAGAARRISVPRVLREHGVVLALGGLVAVQWLAILAFALTVRHNGWLYYQGGDQLWHYTTASFLADGDLPFTTVGFAWPFALLPVAAAAGPQYLDALPAIVLLNVLVLLPAAVLLVYALGARLAGRAVGLLAAALWVVLPWAAVPLFDHGYHEKYVEQFLTQPMGLTGMSDLPSTVALLGAAVLTARVLERDDVWAGAAAGLATGIAIGVKPSVAIALPAFAVAAALAGRWRALLGAGAGLALPLLALIVWKARGVGYLPAFALGEPSAFAAGGVFEPVDKYVDWSLDHARRLERDLRGEFFSVRVLELLPLAGVVGLFRRTPPGAVLVGGWFVLVVLVRAGSPLSSIDNGSFLRYLMPAFPAFCVLAASVLLLVPSLGGRLAAMPGPPPPGRRASFWITATLAVATAAVLGATALATPLEDPVAVRAQPGQPMIPVVDDFEPEITADGRRIDLRWKPAPGTNAATFYRVFRGQGETDLDCSGSGAIDCTLAMQPVGETREPSFSEEPPGAGRWIYRVSVAANWLDDTTQGDPTLLSRPVVVTTR